MYQRVIAFLTLAVFLCLFVSCDEKKPSPDKKSAASDSDNDGPLKPGKAETDDVCSRLDKHSIKDKYDSLIKTLCSDSGAAALSLYRGTGDPEVVREDQESGSRTFSRVYGGYQTPSKVLSVYNMMLLMISEPSNFDTEGFESDSFVTFSSAISNTRTVSYTYKNNKEKDSVIEYKADSVFYKVNDGMYIITTDLTESLQTVIEFKGLQVIYKDKNDLTTVLSISEQRYENQSNHATAVSRSTQAIREDLARSFRNAKSAEKADSYFSK